MRWTLLQGHHQKECGQGSNRRVMVVVPSLNSSRFLGAPLYLSLFKNQNIITHYWICKLQLHRAAINLTLCLNYFWSQIYSVVSKRSFFYWVVSIDLLFSDPCQYHMNFLPKITLLQQGPLLDNVLNLKKCWQNQDKKGRRLPNSIYF